MTSYIKFAAAVSIFALVGCEPGTGLSPTPPDADTPLTCDASDASCATRHAIKADACLRLAQDEINAARAGGVVAASRAACARQNFATALGTLPDAQGTVGAGNLAALRVARQIASSSAVGQQANSALDRAATSYAAKHPALNAGAYYLGDAALYRGLRAGGSACPNLSAAIQLAEAAATRQNPSKTPSLSSAIATLDTQAKQAAEQRGCSS